MINFVRAAATATVLAATAPEVTSVVLVAGAYLAVGAAWYYFSQRNREDIQAKAKEKYIAANPDSDVAGTAPFQGGQGVGIGYEVFMSMNEIYIPENSTRKITFSREVYGAISRIKADKMAEGNEAIFLLCQGYVSEGFKSEQFYRAVFNSGGFDVRYTDVKIDGIRRLDGQPDTDGNAPSTAKPWSQWTDAQRQSAISGLNDSDWAEVAKLMPRGGTLERGQAIPNDAILTGNPDSDFEAERNTRIIPANTKIPTIYNDQAATYGAAAAIGAGAAIGTLAPDLASVKQGTADVAKNLNEFKNDATKRLKSIAGFLNFDRILNLLIWWQTLHNAFMLSADLGRSLVSGFSTVLKALPGDSLLGLPTESADGSPLDLATVINTNVETWIKGAIGAENYVKMKTSLAEVNRIYQATANGINLIQGMIQSTQSMVELVGERVGRIGNSMKRFGLVGERAYSWMSENLNARTGWFDRLQERISNTQEVVSSVEQIAGSVISIQDSVTQLKGEKKQIETSLEKLDILESKDNESVKTKIDVENKNSQSPEITVDDLSKPEPQQT